MVVQKRSGFEGELIIELPKSVLSECHKLPVINTLFIDRMGFYPKAMHHYFQRPAGISQVILLYCIDGKGWVQLKKNKVHMEAGSVCMIPSGMSHSYGADIDKPWTIYWFHLLGSHSAESTKIIFGSKENTSLVYKFGLSSKRDGIFRQIAATFLKGYSVLNLMLANLLMHYYLASFIAPEFFQDGAILNTGDRPTDKAIYYMQQNLARTITLDNIAQSARLSVSFFCKTFKEDTGYAPIEYFNHLRIQQACQLLHFSKLRINEVASQIGIDDPFYFSRLFKKQMGISPVAYRKSEGVFKEKNVV
jgi:AraC-like DNA-binding protein